MDTYEARVLELLKENGAKLIRKRKHKVWKLTDGRKWTTPTSASDTASWQNNYTDLRRALGMKSQDKVQSSFDHQKKDPYVRKHSTDSSLEEIEALDVLPSPPPGPTKKERELLELAKKKLAEENPTTREFFQIGGRFPLAIKRGTNRAPLGRSTRAYTFSEEVKTAANNLLLTEGEAAAKRYLDNVKFGICAEHPKAEEKQEEEMSEQTNGNGNLPVLAGGTLEDLLQKEKNLVRQFKAAEQNAKLEIIRHEKVVEQLEAALQLTTASKETIKGLVTAEQPPSGGRDGVVEANKPRGYWKTLLTEVVVTSPVSFTKRTLVDELARQSGSEKRNSIYQVIYAGLQSGWLFEVDGFVRVRDTSEKKTEA